MKKLEYFLYYSDWKPYMNANIEKAAAQNFQTPVLLIIFNRLSPLLQIIEVLRQVKPSRLYIAADGPRAHVVEDKTKCAEARGVVDLVDWPCEVKTLFRSENLGCGLGPSQAMSWFFEHEEMGIILEDDILPALSFFPFCEELLNKYKDDTRVFQISGMNVLGGWQRNPEDSYYFARIASTWGWATWRRSWKHFDYWIKDFETIYARGYFDEFIYNRPETSFILDYLREHAQNGKVTSVWDYQWLYARYINSGLCIVPNVNLTKNIGFGEDATHTFEASELDQEISLDEIAFPLIHPNCVIADQQAERRQFDLHFGYSRSEKYIQSIKQLILLVLGAKVGRSLIQFLKKMNGNK